MRGSTTSIPRPLFVYGTLLAEPLLAWAFTGDSANVEQIRHIIKPATVKGYTRLAVKNCDYPAAIPSAPDEHGCIEAHLLLLETQTQRNKLDDFEGEIYKPVAVAATVIGTGEPKEADMYVWDGDMDKLGPGPWDLQTFVNERRKTGWIFLTAWRWWDK